MSDVKVNGRQPDSGLSTVIVTANALVASYSFVLRSRKTPGNQSVKTPSFWLETNKNCSRPSKNRPKDVVWAWTWSWSWIFELMFENSGCGFLVSKHRKAAGTTGITVFLLFCHFGAPFYLNPTQISVNCEARSSSGGNRQLNFNGSRLCKFLLMGFFILSLLYQVAYLTLWHNLVGVGRRRMRMEGAAEIHTYVCQKPHKHCGIFQGSGY